MVTYHPPCSNSTMLLTPLLCPLAGAFSRVDLRNTVQNLFTSLSSSSSNALADKPLVSGDPSASLGAFGGGGSLSLMARFTDNSRKKNSRHKLDVAWWDTRHYVAMRMLSPPTPHDGWRDLNAHTPYPSLISQTILSYLPRPHLPTPTPASTFLLTSFNHVVRLHGTLR